MKRSVLSSAIIPPPLPLFLLLSHALLLCDARRSLGDGDLKSVGLTAQPEVLHFQLSAQDECLVLASDGLWDCMGNQEALQIINDTVKQPAMCAQRWVT